VEFGYESHRGRKIGGVLVAKVDVRCLILYILPLWEALWETSTMGGGLQMEWCRTGAVGLFFAAYIGIGIGIAGFGEVMGLPWTITTSH
jgi:hypothetical protein